MFFKKNKKKAFVSIEYILIGAILLIGSTSLATFSVDRSTKDVETGSKNLSDKEGKIETNGSNGSYIINYLNVNPDDISMLVGETKKVTATIQPSNIWDVAVDWTTTTADADIIELSEASNGRQSINVTGKKEGKALLTAKTTDGSNLSKDVIVRVGVKGEGVNITGPLNVKSTEAITLQVNFDNPDVTWNNKEVQWTIKNGADAVVLQSDLTSRQILLAPRTGDTSVTVHCLVKDLVFDVTSEAEFTVNISQVWSEWSTSPSNKPGEQMRKQYRELKYSVWSENYNYAYGQPGEIRNSNGSYKTALAGYGPDLQQDPQPSNPLVRRITRYRESNLISRYVDTTTPPPSNLIVKGSSSKTQHGQQVSTGCSTSYSTSKPGSKYCSATEYAYRTRDWVVTGSYSCVTGNNCCRDRYYNNVGSCPPQCTHDINNYGSGCSCMMRCYFHDAPCYGTCNNYGWSGWSGWQGWRTSGPYSYSNTGSRQYETTSRPVYSAVTSWGSPFGWRDTPYSETPTNQLHRRTVYSYETWQNWGDYKDCPNRVCPSSTGTKDVQTIIRFNSPIMSKWSDWDWPEKVAVSPSGNNPGSLAESRNMYRFPINSVQ